MLLRSDALALLKVLLAAAWADSTITNSEMNYIKSLATRFELRDQDWLELQPYMEDPPGEAETEGLFRDLLTRIATPAGRRRILHHLQSILAADSEISAAEHDFLEQYTTILEEASTVELLVGRLRGFFQRPQLKGAVDLDEFVRNKVLFKLKRRLGSDRVSPELQRLCLLGGLLGIVAQADGDMEDREVLEIRHALEGRGNFDPEQLDVLMGIILEESARGLDRARLISEYTANFNLEQRVELLDLLFAVAAANNALTYAELEELRAISAALNLSHKQYIAAKIRTRE